MNITTLIQNDLLTLRKASWTELNHLLHMIVRIPANRPGYHPVRVKSSSRAWCSSTWCIPPCLSQLLGCSLHLVSAHEWWPHPGSPCPLRRTSPDHTPRCYYPCTAESSLLMTKLEGTLTAHNFITYFFLKIENVDECTSITCREPPNLSPLCTCQSASDHTLRFLALDLLDPDEWVVKLWIYGLQVFERQRFIQDSLVERQRETSVYEFAMEQGLEQKCSAVRLSEPSNHVIVWW